MYEIIVSLEFQPMEGDLEPQIFRFFNTQVKSIIKQMMDSVVVFINIPDSIYHLCETYIEKDRYRRDNVFYSDTKEKYFVSDKEYIFVSLVSNKKYPGNLVQKIQQNAAKTPIVIYKDRASKEASFIAYRGTYEQYIHLLKNYNDIESTSRIISDKETQYTVIEYDLEPKNILVLGASGMAGHVICEYLEQQGYKVTALSRKSAYFTNTVVCDLCNEMELKKVLQTQTYDIIINCAGILNQQAEQNISEAIYINAYLPHHIVNLIKGKPTKLIQLSTDCVFSGRNGPYYEDSICDGTTVYDRTKALGEVRDDKNLTIRMSIIGPDRNRNGIGLFHWFMQQKGTINGYSECFWSGITTIVLAKAIEQAIEQEITGLYQLVSSEPISKYELCMLFNHYFKQDTIQITPYEMKHSNKVLVNSREDFIFKVPSYREMIQEMKDWIADHAEWYPLY